MICTQCGHDNPAENKYCGMCGTTLERRPATVATSPLSVADRLRELTDDEPPKSGRNNSGSAESRRVPVPSFLGLDEEAPRRRPAVSSSGISGPSFLGLDAPPERSNYLLEDEESHSHWRGYLVALLIMAVAILAALQWRAEVKTQAYRVGAILWARMHSTPQQPSINEKVASGTQPDTTAPAPAPTTSPASNTTSSGAPAADTTPPASPSPAPAQPANESPAATTPASSVPAANKPASANLATDQQPALPRPSPPEAASAANSRRPAAGKDPQADALLLNAQKYLHGLGVPRDCEQGLLYLKEAVRQPSAPARSQMGALYATGTCVPQNRVEAYRWFSSAMEVEPNNPWLGRERDSLYGEMTSAERQQLNR